MVALDDDDDRVLDHLINGGFFTPDQLKRAFFENYLDNALSEDERRSITEEIDRRVVEVTARQQTWTDPTTYDQLDHAFVRLNRRDRIVAVHHAGFSQTEAFEHAAAICRERGGSRSGILGAAYYSEQDIETVLESGVLRLSFFGLGSDETVGGAKASLLVTKVLARLVAEGLPARWSGDHQTKIDISPVRWTKRLPTPSRHPRRQRLLELLLRPESPTQG